MAEDARARELERVNTDTGLLKTVAILTMVVDHIGAMLLRDVPELRIIGRVAFPLFAWGIVVGMVYTRNPARYAARLLLLALLSQAGYMLGLNHRWSELNVVFTLLLGMLGIWGMRWNRWGSAWWGPALCVLTASLIPMDYGWRGVLFIQLLYLARTSPGALAACMIPYCLFWGAGAGSRAVTEIWGVPLVIPGESRVAASFNSLLAPFLRLQTLALLALPLMAVPTKSGIRLPRWLGYLAYPGHLMILYLIQQALTRWQIPG